MEVVWSDMALTQLDEVIDYVEEHFGLLTSQNVLVTTQHPYRKLLVNKA